MKVGELIEELKKFRDNQIVYVRWPEPKHERAMFQISKVTSEVNGNPHIWADHAENSGHDGETSIIEEDIDTDNDLTGEE